MTRWCIGSMWRTFVKWHEDSEGQPNNGSCFVKMPFTGCFLVIRCTLAAAAAVNSPQCSHRCLVACVLEDKGPPTVFLRRKGYFSNSELKLYISQKMSWWIANLAYLGKLHGQFLGSMTLKNSQRKGIPWSSVLYWGNASTAQKSTPGAQ